MHGFKPLDRLYQVTIAHTEQPGLGKHPLISDNTRGQLIHKHQSTIHVFLQKVRGWTWPNILVISYEMSRKSHVGGKTPRNKSVSPLHPPLRISEVQFN